MFFDWSALKKLIWLRAAGVIGAVWKTVTNVAVASFTAVAAPVRALVVDINPAQDLHGYDDPWPAGGGVNRLNPASVPDENKYVTSITGDLATPTGSYEWRHTDYIPVTPGEVLYIGEVYGIASNAGSAWYDSNKGYVSGFNSTQLSNADGVVTVPQGVAYLRHSFCISSEYNPNWETTVYIIPNSSPHVFTPYSNICPISGWTGAKVWVEPTHDTTANPTVTIDLDGTVYGGTLNVTTGVLTVDRLIYVLNGTEIWSRFNPSDPSEADRAYYRCKIAESGYFTNENNICSHFKTTRIGSTTSDIGFGTINSSLSEIGAVIAIRPDLSVLSNTGRFQQYLSQQYANGTPVTCVCGISAPQVIQLSATELATLAGQNNVWADTGNINTITYRES